MFYGNKAVKTFSIAEGARFIGAVGLGAQVGVDAIGLRNYAINPGGPNTVSPLRADFDTSVGIVGLFGGPVGLGALIGVVSFDVTQPGRIDAYLDGK